MSIPTGASEHACNPFTELSNSDPVKSLHEMYELFKVDWNGSTAGKAVAKTLDERVISRKDIEITEALCLGVGELNNRRTSFRERSLGQLAIFACVLDILKSRFQISKIYVQDPAFKVVDVRFLRMLGFTVIWENSAQLYIKKSTFLYAPHCAWDAIFPLFSHVQPPLFIGNEKHNYCCEECVAFMLRQTHVLQHPALRSFYESRASFFIPLKSLDGGWGSWIHNMKMYCKAGQGEPMDEWVKKFYEDIETISEDDISHPDDERAPQRFFSHSVPKILPPRTTKKQPLPTENSWMHERIVQLRGNLDGIEESRLMNNLEHNSSTRE